MSASSPTRPHERLQDLQRLEHLGAEMIAINARLRAGGHRELQFYNVRGEEDGLATWRHWLRREYAIDW